MSGLRDKPHITSAGSRGVWPARTSSRWRLEDGTQIALLHHREGVTYEITLADSTVRTIKALMPGRIVRVSATKGQRVQKGDGLLVLEAMKMENEIQAQVDGTVDEVFVTAGQTVEGGAELAHITPL